MFVVMFCLTVTSSWSLPLSWFQEGGKARRWRLSQKAVERFPLSLIDWNCAKGCQMMSKTFSLQLSASLISVSSTPFPLSLLLFKNTDRFSSCDSGEAEERSVVKVSSSMITSGLNDPRERFEFILLSVFTENTALVWVVCPYLGQ